MGSAPAPDALKITTADGGGILFNHQSLLQLIWWDKNFTRLDHYIFTRAGKKSHGEATPVLTVYHA